MIIYRDWLLEVLERYERFQINAGYRPSDFLKSSLLYLKDLPPKSELNLELKIEK